MDKGTTRRLPPVRTRWKWNTYGLLLQLVGAVVPAAVVAGQANQDGVLDSLTRVTVRLVWHQVLQNHRDEALIAGGVVVFVAGAIVLARPYVHSYWTWLVAVPIAALAGVAVLGVLAVVIAAILTAIGDTGGSLLDAIDISPDWGKRRRRRRLQN